MSRATTAIVWTLLGACGQVLIKASLVEAFIAPIFPGRLGGGVSPPPVVILPGFGNAREDYTLPFNGQLGEESSFAYALQKRGHAVYVVDVKRTDWLKFASGIITPDFWSSALKPTNPSFSWYLKLVVEAVEEAVDKEGRPVVLIGHSAGGWLGRAVMGDGQSWPGASNKDGPVSSVISGFVTLGSPHLPPGPDSAVMDMTRGALSYVDRTYPGAFLKGDGVFYATVAGAAIKGEMSGERRDPSRFAYNSYYQVCGQGDVVGDGVVPVISAHLEGAQQITLPNVYHSINAIDRWYGCDAVMDKWYEKIPGLRAKRGVVSKHFSQLTQINQTN